MLALIALVVVIFSLSMAQPTNRTIDDTFGDSETGRLPVYLPPTAWGGNNCTGCAIQPDRDMAFDGTWMAVTYHPALISANVSFSFEGLSIS